MYRSNLKYIVTGVLCFSSFSQIIPQEITFSQGSPEWLVQQFFKSEAFPDKEKYFIGEMLKDAEYPTIGEELEGKGEIGFYLFESTDQIKAFAVNIKVDSKILDFYCFLSNTENGWKIEAVRRFLFPKFIYTASDSLSSIDSLSAADSSILKILKLMTATDEHLKNYLIQNISSFEKLVHNFDNNNKDSVSVLINELSLNGIFRDEKYPGCIFIQISEMESREAGFIFKEADGTLPKISTTKFIFINQIVDGWYLYRLI